MILKLNMSEEPIVTSDKIILFDDHMGGVKKLYYIGLDYLTPKNMQYDELVFQNAPTSHTSSWIMLCWLVIFLGLDLLGQLSCI